MKTHLTLIVLLSISLISAHGQEMNSNAVTVPIVLDHNRMLVEAGMQRKDGTWRTIRLWVDSGSPEFFISESLARDLGIDLSAAEDTTFTSANLEIESLPDIRIGGKSLDLTGVRSVVKFRPYWLFSTMHTDGNLPSTLLKKYHIIFDYPRQMLTIADQGSIKPQGDASILSINPQTGIIQMDALINEENLSFALDMGASYCFISEEIMAKWSDFHPDWPQITGTLGCSNMWGWWPANEQQFPVVRIPLIKWGNETFTNVGFAGVTNFSPGGPSLGEWYSRKTAKPVDGFIGANVLKDYRVEIDYAKGLIYFKKGKQNDETEMDMVGISIRQLPDSTYQVAGIVKRNGEPAVKGMNPDDVIISIDGVLAKGKTMGKVVDMLRGVPGTEHKMLLRRDENQILISAKIEHFL